MHASGNRLCIEIGADHEGDKATVAPSAPLVIVARPHDLDTGNVSKADELPLQHLCTSSSCISKPRQQEASLWLVIFRLSLPQLQDAQSSSQMCRSMESFIRWESHQ